MNNSRQKRLPDIIRVLGAQGLLGACLGFIFGVVLLVSNVANMGDLFLNTDVKLLAGFLYFSSLMSTFAIGMVGSFAFSLGEDT
jgi:hypothetical protein